MTQSQIQISQLPPAPAETGSGTSKGTDIFPATDITNTAITPTGQTNKYALWEINNWILQAQGFKTYNAAQVATTANLTATYSNGASGIGATLTNSGTQLGLIIDGITLSVGSIVLVWQQSTQYQNGLYTVTNIGSSSSNWVLTRSTNFDASSEIITGAAVVVNQGATYAGLLFQVTSAGPYTIGSTIITFALFSYSGISYPVSLANGGTGSSLSVVDSAVFSVNSGGTTVLSATLPSGLTIPGYATSGANSNITSLTGLTGVIQAPTQINDVNGNPVLNFDSVPNAVNTLGILNNSTGGPPIILSGGADTNVGMQFNTLQAGVYTYFSTASSAVINYGTGTDYQHGTSFSFANTAASQTITWPDASGTVLITTGKQQLASAASILLDKGTGTESSNAVTINKQSGVITTTSLTTAQYATETITLTNSEIAATSVVLVSVMGGGNTTTGITVRATAGSGSSTIVLTNLNSSALNGTVIIGFAVF